MRRRVVKGAAVIVAIAVIGGCSEHRRNDAVHAAEIEVATTDDGPRFERFGVPQGWSRDEAGARAAAISAVSLSGQIAVAGFISRADMLGALASDRFRPTLMAESSRQLDRLLGDLPADGVALPTLLFRELPLTAHALQVDSRTARIDVWSVVVVGVPDRGAPRQAWRTVTVDLVWERNDWRVDGWTPAAGPTPALATNVEVATIADLTAVLAWSAIGLG